MHKSGSRAIELILGDITLVDAEAIVNAANRSLMGGGGVDGAIHKAAGPGLMEECSRLNGCETGEAVITGGHDLKARYVIHTVGPVWHDGLDDEHHLLASCYQKSLRLATENGIRSVAFPGISTGIYGFPKDQAALIAVTEVKRYLNRHSLPERIIFVLFDREAYDIYTKYLND